MYICILPFSVVPLALRSPVVVITTNVRMGVERKEGRKEEEYLLAEEGMG